MWNCQLCVLAAQQICQYPPNMDLLDLGPRGKFSSLKSNRKFIPARISRSVEPCASFKAFLINCLSRKLQLKPFDHRFIATKTSSHCAAVITHLHQPCSLVPDPNSTMVDQPSIPSISLPLIHPYLLPIHHIASDPWMGLCMGQGCWGQGGFRPSLFTLIHYPPDYAVHIVPAPCMGWCWGWWAGAGYYDSPPSYSSPFVHHSPHHLLTSCGGCITV